MRGILSGFKLPCSKMTCVSWCRQPSGWADATTSTRERVCSCLYTLSTYVFSSLLLSPALLHMASVATLYINNDGQREILARIFEEFFFKFEKKSLCFGMIFFRYTFSLNKKFWWKREGEKKTLQRLYCNIYFIHTCVLC